MKMQDALAVIEDRPAPKGFMVHFERVEGRMLAGDYFPDKHAGEPLIETEEKAWDLAYAFANKTRKSCVNVYVVDHSFRPVATYRERMLENR